MEALMNETSRKTAIILVVPFVISASVEFFPAWLYWPISILGGMIWVGALVQLGGME
jgi:hypothetical protein